MEIRFGRYKIRSFEKGDVDSLVRYGNNRNVSIQLKDSFPYPYRKADAQRWLSFVEGQSPETNFAIAVQEELIGGIGLVFGSDIARLSAEIGYWLGEPFWGKGIMGKAVPLLVAYCFENFEIERIWAGVFCGNEASMCVLGRAGFSLEGVLRRAVVKEGELKDKFLYSLLREEWKAKLRG